jgi:hypothetical protein
MSGIGRKNAGNAGRRLCAVKHCRSGRLKKLRSLVFVYVSRRFGKQNRRQQREQREIPFFSSSVFSVLSCSYFPGFFVSSTGSKITVTGVPRGGMRSVNASNSSSALFLELLIGRSSMAPSKLETQITSPAFAA